MFDVTKFNDRNGWTIKDLARRLFDKGGESRVGMWSSGDSNPRYESILKLIDLGATAQELFGEELGSKLVQNSTTPSATVSAPSRARWKPTAECSRTAR